VPYVSPSGAVATWQPTDDAQSMEAKVEQKDFDQLFYLQNKTPKWDEAHGGHVLNFQVRILLIQFIKFYTNNSSFFVYRAA
jgi:hypothetical protein